MTWGDLRGKLAEQGLTILAGALGGPAGAVAATVGRGLADRMGVTTPEEVAEALATPGGRNEAVAYETASADELRALGLAQSELALAETRSESAFSSRWRPAMSWLLIVMWAWNAMILPVAVGITGAVVAAIPYDQLLAFSGLWLTIYGGGHTVKSIMGSKR